jgi:serine/threonine protein phosphatase PrpC
MWSGMSSQTVLMWEMTPTAKKYSRTGPVEYGTVVPVPGTVAIGTGIVDGYRQYRRTVRTGIQFFLFSKKLPVLYCTIFHFFNGFPSWQINDIINNIQYAFNLAVNKVPVLCYHSESLFNTMPSTDKYSTSEYDVSATGETSKDTRTTAMSDSSEGMMTHHHQQQQQVQVQEQTVLPPIALVSTCEEMNPARRCAFEDCAVYAAAGTWDAPDPNMAFLCICDGHGGRQMVEYLEDWLVFHVRVELGAPDDGEERMDNNTNNKDHPIDILQRLERAFLIADIHSKTFGVDTSGATVAVCLVTRTMNNTPDNGRGVWTIYAANAGDARIVLGHDGKAHQMTKDHRTDDPDEVRRIEENGGFLFKGRVLGVLAVTRSLGDHW